MYDECLKCPKLGNPCDGPNFIAMKPAELIEWCNARRKQIPGLTYDRIAENTGLSKGTVSGFFGGLHADYRLETVRPILEQLVGGKWEDSPCADPSANERAAYEERIAHLENEIRWRDDKIKQFEDNTRAMQTLITNTNARNTTDKDFLRGQINSKARTVRVLAVALTICILIILGALLVDRADPSKGFFWLEGLLRLPQGFADHMNINS